MSNQISLSDHFYDFNLPLLPGWVAYFSEEKSTEIRLVKGNVVAILEYFSVGSEDSAVALDDFFDIESKRIQETINGAFIYDDDEGGVYEILAENLGEFSKFFYSSSQYFVFRFSLRKYWLPSDEEEISKIISGITSTSELGLAEDYLQQRKFRIKTANWQTIGKMYLLSSDMVDSK